MISSDEFYLKKSMYVYKKETQVCPMVNYSILWMIRDYIEGIC